MDEHVRQALARGGVIDITTKGRRTGKPHRIEIVFHNLDGHIYIVGLPRAKRRDWMANLEADPHFTFHLKGKVDNLPPGMPPPPDLVADLPAVARPITDATERRPILERATQWSKDRDIEKILRESPLIEITFEGD